MNLVKYPNDWLDKDVTKEQVPTEDRHWISSNQQKIQNFMDKCGALAISANQLSLDMNFCVITFHPRGLRSNKDKATKMFLLQPVIIQARGSQKSRESSISLPGRSFFVQAHHRPFEVKVQFMDLFGDMQNRKFKSFNAVIFMHILDTMKGNCIADYGQEIITEPVE